LFGKATLFFEQPNFSHVFLCTGRLVAGIGVGIGFISSSVAIKDCTEFQKRQQAFMIAAILFSGSALFSGLLALLRGISYFHFVFILTMPSFIAGRVFLEKNEFNVIV
jgi:hypothetical protein